MNINFNKFDPIKGKSELEEQFSGAPASPTRRRSVDPRLLQRIMGMMQQRRKPTISSGQPSIPDTPSGDGNDFGNLGGLMQQMMGGQKGQQEIPMWDAYSGKKQQFMKASDAQQGLESSRDINGNIMKGYMQAAAQLRVSQPSGGTDPTKFNVPHGSGTDPRMVRGLSPEELPMSMDYKALDKASMQSKQAGMQDPQVQKPHQTPGAPVDIPDGMGGVDQQKKQAMTGAQFFGGKPEMPQPQQQGGMPPQGGMPQGGMPPQGMMQQMMQQMMQKGKKPAMPTKKKRGPLSDPKMKDFLKKLMQHQGGLRR